MTEELNAVRRRALILMGEYTAGVEGAQQEILVDGGWDEKSQPSADFCHWMLWKLGCRDSRILSRNVPGTGIVHGDGLFKKLCEGAQRLDAWRPFQLDTAPLPGDILLSGVRRKGEQERCRVVIAVDSPRMWRAVDTWLDRTNTLRISETPVEIRGEELVRPGGRETLVGWVNLVGVLGE